MSGDNLKYQNAEESPESLYDITLKYVVENIDILYDCNLSDPKLRKDFRLPSELCER